MNTTALVLCILGLCIAWLPDWGWLGIAMSAGGVSLGIWCLTDPKTGPAGLGFDVAGGIIGTIAMVFGISFQVKHLAPALDFLTFNLEPSISLAAGTTCFAAYFGAQVMGRKKNRVAGIVLAVVAVAACVVLCVSSVTAIDRGLSV